MAKQRPAKSRRVGELVAAVTGTPVEEPEYVGKKLYGRKGTKFAKVAARITNVSACRLEGCRGLRVHALWPDGHRTYPCLKGCSVRPDGDLEIR